MPPQLVAHQVTVTINGKLPTAGTGKIRLSVHIAITQQNLFPSVARSLLCAGDHGSLNVSYDPRRFGELRAVSVYVHSRSVPISMSR